MAKFGLLNNPVDAEDAGKVTEAERTKNDGEADKMDAGTLRAGMQAKFNVQFQCPACKQNLREPIVSCLAGHNICQLCRNDQSCCPSCNGGYPNVGVRNLALETMIRELYFPISCKETSHGCEFASSIDDVVVHEKVCTFRSVKCGLVTCLAPDVRFNGLEEHMEFEHPEMTKGEWTIKNITRVITALSRWLYGNGAYDMYSKLFELCEPYYCWQILDV
jgi:hypothetical protein